jgi:Mg2+ and Co2+ transporter CorA
MGPMEVHVIAVGAKRHPVEELPALLARDDILVWLDIPEQDAEAVRVLTEIFHLDQTALQSCARRNRIPKLHRYDDQILIVLHAPEHGERGHVHYLELDQIIGPNYLVTVHGPVNPAVPPEAALRDTRAVLARIHDGRLRPANPFELSGAIVSALSQRMEGYVEDVTADAWQIEQQVTADRIGDPEEFLNNMFRTRHGLLAVRTMAALSAASYTQLASMPGISSEHRPLITDRIDEFERVRAIADGEREYLQGVMDFYQTALTVKATLAMRTQNERIQSLTEASYAQNERVKKISAWAAIFFGPTFVATLYGMNFDNMPELHWILGYPFSLLVMALVSLALYYVFRHLRWL